MGDVLKWVSGNYSFFELLLMGIFIIGFLVFIIVIVRLNKLARQYRALMRGVDGKNLEEIVFNNTKKLDEVMLKIKIFEEKLNEVEKISKNSIHNVSVIRFNAFEEMGGDLSFALALLNYKGDGVVVSSIYGRDDARTYAKPVRGGKSNYQLSAEELEAIKRAYKGG